MSDTLGSGCRWLKKFIGWKNTVKRFHWPQIKNKVLVFIGQKYTMECFHWLNTIRCFSRLETAAVSRVAVCQSTYQVVNSRKDAIIHIVIAGTCGWEKMLTMLPRLRRTRFSDLYDVAQRAAFLSQSTMPEMKVFNRATKLKQRNRAASQPDYQDYEFIRCV